MKLLASRLFAISGWAVWVLAANAPAQEPLTIRNMLKPGLEGVVTDTDGMEHPMSKFWCETPTDLEEPGELAGPYRWESDPPAPSLVRIRSIRIQSERIEWVGSNAFSTEYYRLGSVGRASAPPPNWEIHFGRNEAWQKAVPADPGSSAPYLNGAQFLWTRSKFTGEEATGEFLFRQRFIVSGVEAIAQVTLRLAGDVHFKMAAINGQPVLLENRDKFGLGEFEVTKMLKNGENIIALWFWNSSSPPMTYPAFAFHLEVSRLDLLPRGGDADPSQALLLVHGGDRLWGRVESITGEQLQIQTQYGRYTLPWELARTLIFPYGWNVNAPGGGATRSSSMIERLFKGRKPSDVAGPAHGIPIQFSPEPIGAGLLLVDGRKTSSWPSRLEGEDLVLESSVGNAYTIKAKEVAAIYPQSGVTQVLRKPRPELVDLFCRVKTRRGEIVSGILRRLNRKQIVIESPGGDFLTFAAADLLRIVFPHHGLQGIDVDPSKPRVIGLLAQAGGIEQYAGAYRQLSAQIQESTFLAGLETSIIGQDLLVENGRLTPRDYPVLASIDPLGEYLDTLNEKGDASAALENYIRQGGVLILYSRGGALRTAVVNSGGRFIRTLPAEGLAGRLKIRTLFPGEGASLRAIPFDRPINQALEIGFERIAIPPERLLGLPERIELGSMLTASYYPMVQSDGSNDTIYRLRDSRGRRYGPALSVVTRGQGKIIIIDHLLWHATTKGQLFTRAILPHILQWALQGAPLDKAP